MNRNPQTTTLRGAPRYGSASLGADQARAFLTDANERAAGFVRQHPVPCLVGAVALGYLVGRAAARRWLW